MARSLKKKNFDPRTSFVTSNSSRRYSQFSADALEVWYEFDSGAIAVDGSGRNRNATNNGVTPSSDTPYTTNLFASSGEFGTSKSITVGSALSDIYANNTFTISVWINFSSTSGTQRILQLGGVAQGIRFECISGALKITDSAWATTGGVHTYNSFFSANTWTHVLVKLDRSTAGYTPTIVKNGATVSANSSTASAGTRQNLTGDTYIGQSGATSEFVDGKIDSLAIWSIQLTNEDVAAVYQSSGGVSEIRSGILSNPARILLQDRDNKTGSYPTIARTGDPDFTGRFASTFDDTKIVNFVGGELVYPSVLPASSFWISGGVATPNVLQGLTTAGTASKGVSDSHVSFTPGENISPFNESRIYIDNGSTFYTTGTASGTLPGFGGKLSSKTILSLDINPSSATNVYFSTGSSAHTRNTGMTYWNWGGKKWEVVGDGGSADSVDIFNSNPAIRSAAVHPATGIPEFAMSSPLSDTARHVGRFHSTHGFPFATQYNSTGSQELSLTGTLSGPFLLEKAVLEFSASYASYPNQTLGDGPLCYQFFLLNVAPVSDTVTIVQDLTGSGTGTPGTFTTRNAQFSTTQVKDLVWSGEIGRVYTGVAGTDGSASGGAYARDLTLLKVGADSAGIAATTGTFRVESAARIYGKNDGLTTHSLRGDGSNVPLMANKIGFRNFAGFVEGKSFIRPIAAITPSGSFTADGDFAGSNRKYTVSFISNNDLRAVSPYVLLPNHKLVLGFYGVPIQGNGGVGSAWAEYAAADHVTTLSPGLGRLTLYGSQLRNNLPVEPETNQPLTSDAIHESLYGGSVFDQFDVEPFEYLTGSYVDNIITGSMLVSPLGDPTAANVRKVQASVAAGGAGTTGSLQRFVSLVSENERYYDSYPPDFSSFANLLNKGYGSRSGQTVVAFYTDSDATAGQGRYGTGNWFRRFVFENNVKRSLAVSRVSKLVANAFDVDSHAQVAENVSDFAAMYLSYSPASSNNSGLLVGPGGATAGITEFKKYLWGFGKGTSGSLPSFEVNNGNIPIIRGFRYGLNGLFGHFATNKFRRDRYGQFRDMLEQSTDTTFLVGRNTIDCPIEISFFSRPKKDGMGRAPTTPTNTFSQNLSPYSTSSLPFFDTDKPDLTTQTVGSAGTGNGRDRTDYPDFGRKPLVIDEL